MQLLAWFTENIKVILILIVMVYVNIKLLAYPIAIALAVYKYWHNMDNLEVQNRNSL